MHIRTFYGLRYLVGIVTNYNEWRVVWHKDTDCLASSAQLSTECSEDSVDGPG